MKGTLYECFLLRVQKNLKILISLDNSSKEFKKRISSNPALMKKTEIIWNTDWTFDNMKNYCRNELEQFNYTKLKGLCDNFK